jgi:hypothetical protein
VPVFYQKHFTNSNGLLWVYDRARQRYQELPPQVVCVEKDLYALKPKDGPRDQRVESLALATADGMCASAVRNLMSGTLPPSPETSETIAYFVGLQSARLPWNREHISAIYRNALEEMMRLNTVSVDRMKSVLDHYAKETGDTVNVSAESMVEAVRHKQIQLTVTERPFLHHLFDQAEFVARLLSQMSWDILDSPPQAGFVLCDDPLAIVPSRGEGHIGLGIPGTVKYFPLTSQRCLRIGDIGNVFAHRKIDSHTVRIINQNIAANSDRFIMGPVREQLESVVMRSGSTGLDEEPKFTHAVSGQNDDGSLQRMTRNPRRYFYIGTGTAAP